MPEDDFGKHVEYYLLCCPLEGKSLQTIRWYRQKLGYFSHYLRTRGRSMDIASIDHREIRSFLSHLQTQVHADENNPRRPTRDDSLSMETVHGYFRALHAFFSWAVRERLLTDNPMRDLRAPKVPRHLMPYFTVEEIVRLLNTAQGNDATSQRTYATLILLFDTGIRASELTGLKVSDVNLTQGYLKVIGKGNKERVVPIGRQCQRVLHRYISQYRPDPALAGTDNVFLTIQGYPLRPDYLYRIMVNACRQSGIQIKRPGPHTCRHTFARNFLSNGGNLLVLQRILGHTSLEMVRRYVNLQTDDLVAQQARYSPIDTLLAR
jgi:site-specific recombinase XerD